MPFCSQCGKEVGPADRFCHRCGAPQPREGAQASGNPVARDAFASMTPRTATILCYVPVIGWIVSILVLASQRYRHDRTVRFHAFQGLYLFVAWLMNEQVLKWVLDPISHAGHVHDLVSLLLLGMSIFMMVKASHGEAYSLPLFGELAQRSVAES
jgi:uncharacterized membrane protein